MRTACQITRNSSSAPIPPSVAPDAGKRLRRFMALALLVVPVLDAVHFALGQAMRAIAERLVARQATLAEELRLATDHQLVGLGSGALHDAGHGNSSERFKVLHEIGLLREREAQRQARVVR